MNLRHRSYLIEAKMDIQEIGYSPLTYNRSSNVKRIVICDPSVDEPPHKHDTYFATIERWRYRSKTGRKRLKKPVLDEVIPGTENNCVVGFLDWYDLGKDYYRLAYVKTRSGFDGKGYARKLFEYFYKKYGKKGVTVHWGKMMREEINHLMKSMQKKYPKVTTMGAEYF